MGSAKIALLEHLPALPALRCYQSREEQSLPGLSSLLDLTIPSVVGVQHTLLQSVQVIDEVASLHKEYRFMFGKCP